MIGYSFSTVVGKVSGGFDGELQLVLWAAAVLPLFLFCFRMEQNGRLAELIDRLFASCALCWAFAKARCRGRTSAPAGAGAKALQMDLLDS